MPFLAPIFGAVAAFASTALGSIILNVGLAVGASLLSSILTPQQQSVQSAPAIGGVQLDVQLGDTNPLSFPVGYTATAGARKYINSYGQAGNVPNAYLVEVRQISDIPVSGLNGIWINGQKCTILWGDTPTAQGYPVQEYRSGGIDHLWVKFHNGMQTTADAFLVAQFGTNPDYPWESTAIGTGCAYAVVTALWQRDVWSGSSRLDMLFEPGSALFYDLRKDSTNGGTGLHRWSDRSTWEASDNTAIVLYNLIRGVFYGDEWVFGGRDINAFQLPPSSWIAAANECDLFVPLAGGGTEKQFRCGFEVLCDNEPLSVIAELLQVCNGRLSEIGGIFEILVGAPGAAVYSFTDDDIVITRGQTFTPSPGLNDTRNAIEYSYPEPVEAWASKNGPARFYPEFEARDGERRLARGVQFNASPFGTQNQRLANALVLDDRRWRTHEFTLPPDAWMLTGTSVVNWTSARNQYVNKKFLVMRAVGEPGMCQPVVLREIDPSDWNWSTDWQMPVGSVVLTPIRPGPQTPTGFQVFPATFKDASGEDRRPSIQITYDGNMPDIQSVHVLVRLKASGVYVFEGFVPFEPPYSLVLNAVFLPNETYEVAIRYVPISARETLFTNYLEVTTPDVKLVPGKDFDPFSGVVDFDTIGPGLTGWINWIGQTPRDLVRSIQNIATNVADQELANSDTFREVRTEMALSLGTVEASFQQTITLAIVPLENSVVALADYLTQLSAGDGIDVSTARFRMTTLSGPSGYSRIGAETRVDTADPDAWRGAAWYLDTPNNPLLPTRFLVNADQFIVVSGSDTANPFIFDGTLRVGDALVRNASIADATITGAKIANATITNALIANATITGAKIANATIGSAQIADAAITSAKIGNATIETANIIAGNVTESSAFVDDGVVDLSGSSGDTFVIATISTTASVGQVIIQAEAYIQTSSAFVMYLRKNGSNLSAKSYSISGSFSSPVRFVYVDNLPSTATYTLVYERAFGGSGSAAAFRSILLQNNKR